MRSADVKVFDLQRWLAVIRRWTRLSLAVAAVILTLFIAVTLILPPQYTAQAELVVDARHEQIVNAQPVVQDLPRSTQEANIVDTQVEMLRSRALAAAVVDQLKLVDDPEFNWRAPGASGPGVWLHQMLHALGRMLGSPEPAPAEIRAKVIDAVSAGLSIKRNGLTYVIGVAFTSGNADKAARIANAFANDYLALSWDSKADANQRVNQWVSGRLAGLRQQAEAADAELQHYRISNNLFSASGVPLTEQEISTYNQQAATARAELAEDLARLSTARAQLQRGSTGEDVGEALGSTVIQQLRSQRASVSAQLAGYQNRYGPRHPELLRAQQQLADIDAQIHSEVVRIISNLEAKVQVSRNRLASIEGALNGAQGTLAANNRASVRLNELQRNADSAKAVYESFLNRYKETTAMAGMVAPDGRLVSWADPPTDASFPNLKLNVALGGLVALMAALGAASAAEMFSSGLSTAEEVEERTHVPYVGCVPLLQADRRPIGAPSAYLLSKPLSAFAEAIRGLRSSLLSGADGPPPRVLAITSSLPGEGKTVTALCFAGMLAQQGYRTLLADCDARRATLSQQLGDVGVGLLEVLQGRCSLEDALIRDERTGASFLPLAPDRGAPPDLIASEAMGKLLERLRHEYDIVLLDTPPVLAIADSRSLAAYSDSVLLLAQWRKTPQMAVETSLRMLERAGAHVAGIALTQVDMKQQSRTGFGDPGYYHAKNKGYYVD